MRVAFVYANPRSHLLDQVARGERPDTNLFGANHLPGLGIDARVFDSVLRRRIRRGGLAHRVTWTARELTLPFELHGYDVVCTPLADLLPHVARIRRRPRVVLLSYHLVAALERASGLRRSALAAAVRSAAAVVCTAGAAREALLALTAADATRVHVALLGVDERYWTPQPPADGGYALAVGRDLARDYRTLVQAVEGTDLRVVIVAKRENVAGIALPQNVEVRLDVQPGEVRALYRDAACAVVPVRSDDSRVGTENSGTIALLEAMASGRAAVVSDRACLREYHRPGVTSIAVPAEDAAALRAALESLRDDPARARALGGAARDLVERELTTRRLGERLAGVLRPLVPPEHPLASPA